MGKEGADLKSVKNWCVLMIGLFFIAFGVAFIIHAEKGVLPTTCLPYVISSVCGITVGKAVIIFQSVLILGQMLILRRKYQIVLLLQIPVGIVFGYITDFTLFLFGKAHLLMYLGKWELFFVGVILSAVGVSLEVAAGTVTLATEGFVIAITQIFPVQFGTMKIVFDVLLVVLSLIVSIFCLHRIEGVREGTILSSILLGMFSKIFIRLYERNKKPVRY